MPAATSWAQVHALRLGRPDGLVRHRARRKHSLAPQIGLNAGPAGATDGPARLVAGDELKRRFVLKSSARSSPGHRDTSASRSRAIARV